MKLVRVFALIAMFGVTLFVVPFASAYPTADVAPTPRIPQSVQVVPPLAQSAPSEPNTGIIADPDSNPSSYQAPGMKAKVVGVVAGIFLVVSFAIVIGRRRDPKRLPREKRRFLP